MKIPFCCTSKGRLNTDGKNMVSGCDFCLIMLPAKKPKWVFGPQIVTNITSTCFLELPDNSTVYILQITSSSFCLCHKFLEICVWMTQVRRKKESIKSYMTRPAFSFTAFCIVREKNILCIHRSPQKIRTFSSTLVFLLHLHMCHISALSVPFPLTVSPPLWAASFTSHTLAFEKSSRSSYSFFAHRKLNSCVFFALATY